MNVNQKNKDVAYIELDNGLVVYVDTSTGENIVQIWHTHQKDFKLINGVICENSFPSNVEIKKGE